jgi:outer membrane receptor for ferrienterochelin and colicins
MKLFNIFVLILLSQVGLLGQTPENLTLKGTSINGKITFENSPIEFVNVYLEGTQYGMATDSSGKYAISGVPEGSYTLIASLIGYVTQERKIIVKRNQTISIDFVLVSSSSVLQEVVISGTMKEVSKTNSPVPIEIYTPKYFKANPVATIFDALQNVNGVRPQINCSVCNTGDIHINGLEGPYTMVLIDGMPIVSGLGTVYGLNGIPQSLIERVEVVKGPASTLYGSEAVGGLINVITKKPVNAPIFATEIFGTSWGEINTDLSGKFSIGKKAESLIGLNYFNYSFPIDNNNDNITDLTLQNRISLFNKWNFARKSNKIFSIAGRYVYEDRWGGEMNWTKLDRGGDEVYGENIYTKRWELFGTYQLPFKEILMLQFSANGHDQNSVYGNTPYIANQNIAFSQLTWNKQLKNNDILIGATFRFTNYDDNTPATSTISGENLPSNIYLPGFFIQDELIIAENQRLLLGLRYDYNSRHGNILTPRLNYKWNSKDNTNILRLSFGNGYRVANVFTEDHAALTGARKVEFVSELQPETSRNGNLNFVKKFFGKTGNIISLDGSVFYTYFSNKIIPDYETDPNKIIYDNLNGFAVSQGVSLNVDIAFTNGLKILLGGSYLDVYAEENEIRERQLFTERITGVWNIGYTIPSIGVTLDYTGNLYSPMRLPLLSETDPRKENSPWWSIQNIQFTKLLSTDFEIFGGVKNLLNWTPNIGNPFIIARANDPFDKNVQFDSNGKALVTAENPYGLTFDPTYVYGPNQGIRGFLGLRYQFK